MAEKQGKPVPLDWNIPDNVAGGYATNLVVQHTPHEFIIYFFEARPPLILGSGEALQQQFESINSVRADCIAKITISSTRMPEFLNVLNENFEVFKANMGLEGDE